MQKCYSEYKKEIIKIIGQNNILQSIKNNEISLNSF